MYGRVRIKLDKFTRDLGVFSVELKAWTLTKILHKPVETWVLLYIYTNVIDDLS